MTAEHVSVLLDEVVEVLGSIREGTLVDGTVGQGGHSAALDRKSTRLNSSH